MKTQILTMRDQIARKTNRIEEIKSTLKQSQLAFMKQTESGTSAFGAGIAPDVTSSHASKAEKETNAGSQSGTNNEQRKDEHQDELDVHRQKSFIGGVPTDNIIDLLNEDEQVLVEKLNDINVDDEPDKNFLIDTDDEMIARQQNVPLEESYKKPD